MATTTFEPHLVVDEEVAMSYFYLAPAGWGVAKRTLEVDSGILVDVDAEGLPIGVEIFGDAEVPQMKLISLGVRPHDVAALMFELSLFLNRGLKS